MPFSALSPIHTPRTHQISHFSLFILLNFFPCISVCFRGHYRFFYFLFFRVFSGFRGHYWFLLLTSYFSLFRCPSKPQLLLQIMNISTALLESMVRNDIQLQRHVGLDAVDDDLVERHAHAGQRRGAGLAVGDQLADHGIVVGRNPVTVVDVGIHANAGATRRMVHLDPAGRGHEVFRVFGIDAAFDGVAADYDVLLTVGNAFPGGNAQLLLDDIHAGDHFGDRVLHLDTRVHLDEVELTVLIEEFEGPGPAVTQPLAGIGAALPHRLALLSR